MTGSRANFLSPDSNGQGLYDWQNCVSAVHKDFTDTCNFFSIFEKNCNDWIKSFTKSRWTGLLTF